MRIEFRVRNGDGTTAGGTCDWPADSTDEKAIGLGRARMRSTETTCEILFTPGVELASDEPTIRWEARAGAAQPAGWSLRFTASRA
jgi:hypothetical protein